MHRPVCAFNTRDTNVKKHENDEFDCMLAAYRYENELERKKRGIQRISGKPSEDSSK